MQIDIVHSIVAEVRGSSAFCAGVCFTMPLSIIDMTGPCPICGRVFTSVCIMLRLGNLFEENDEGSDLLIFYCHYDGWHKRLLFTSHTVCDTCPVPVTCSFPYLRSENNEIQMKSSHQIIKVSVSLQRFSLFTADRE